MMADIPVLPLRAGETTADVEIMYRYLQVLTQLLSDTAVTFTYLTAVPTTALLAEGQFAVSLVAGVAMLHFNDAGTIITLRLGEPIP